MSQQNVEIVRAALDASMRGDWESAFREVAPNFELDWSRTIGPVPGVYRGEEAQRVLIDFLESWESVRVEPHEFIEEGEHVVVPTTEHRGRRICGVHRSGDPSRGCGGLRHTRNKSQSGKVCIGG